MKYLGTLCTTLLLAACTSTGEYAPNLGERLLADVQCVNALAAAGISVYAQSQGGGAITAIQVLTKIHEVGTSSVPVTALQACAPTIDYAQQDAAGIRAKIKQGTGK